MSSDTGPSQRGTDSASQIGAKQTGSFGVSTAILRNEFEFRAGEDDNRKRTKQMMKFFGPFPKLFQIFFSLSTKLEVWKLIYEKARSFESFSVCLSLSKFLSQLVACCCAFRTVKIIFSAFILLVWSNGVLGLGERVKCLRELHKHWLSAQKTAVFGQILVFNYGITLPPLGGNFFWLPLNTHVHTLRISEILICTSRRLLTRNIQ